MHLFQFSGFGDRNIGIASGIAYSYYIAPSFSMNSASEEGRE